jgi:hypothetical protein
MIDYPQNKELCDCIDINTKGLKKNLLYSVALYGVLVFGIVWLSTDIYKIILETEFLPGWEIPICLLFIIFSAYGLKKEHLLFMIYDDHLEIFYKSKGKCHTLEKENIKKLTFEHFDEMDTESIFTLNLFILKKNGKLGRYNLLTSLSDDLKYDVFTKLKKSFQNRNYDMEIKDTFREPAFSAERDDHAPR